MSSGYELLNDRRVPVEAKLEFQVVGSAVAFLLRNPTSLDASILLIGPANATSNDRNAPKSFAAGACRQRDHVVRSKPTVRGSIMWQTLGYRSIQTSDAGIRVHVFGRSMEKARRRPKL